MGVASDDYFSLSYTAFSLNYSPADVKPRLIQLYRSILGTSAMLTLKHRAPSLRWHQPKLPRLHTAAQAQAHCFWSWARWHETSSHLLHSHSTFMCNADNPSTTTKCGRWGGHDSIHYKKNSNNAWLNKTANLPTLLHLYLAINTTI